MINEYRKKPTLVKAVVWNGQNIDEVNNFIHPHGHIYMGEVVITTLEGTMRGSCGDYIVKGVKGEFYPCKPDIFEHNHELVSAGSIGGVYLTPEPQEKR